MVGQRLLQPFDVGFASDEAREPLTKVAARCRGHPARCDRVCPAPRVGSCASTRLSSSRSAGPGSRPSSSTNRSRALGVDAERLGLPSPAIQREHAQLPQTLAQRILRAQSDSSSPTTSPCCPNCKRGIEASFHRLQHQFGEQSAFAIGELRERKLCERFTPAKRERIVECGSRGGRVAAVQCPPSLRDEVLEPHDIDVIGRQRQRVAGIGPDHRGDPSVRRRLAIRACRAFVGFPGGFSPHSASISRSALMGSPR